LEPFNEPWIRLEGTCKTWTGTMSNIRTGNSMDRWQCQEMCKSDRNCQAYNQDPVTKACISYNSFAATGTPRERNTICWTRELAIRPFSEPWIRLEGTC
jgi:hypothetical protein